jgi:hypothetical protein
MPGTDLTLPMPTKIGVESTQELAAMDKKTEVLGDAAIAQAFREAADRYKGSGHYDDFIYEVETEAALASYLGYVRLLESGRDRIRDLGGECDPVDVMERNDPLLIEIREVLEALAAQPAPGVGGDAMDGFDLVDDLVIATMSMCAGQAGEHAAAECKAEIIRRLVRLSELEASVAQPAPISGDWDENAVMQAAYEIGGTEDGNYYFDEDELQKFAAQLLATRPAESVAQGGEVGVGYGIIDPDYARIFTIARVLCWSEGYALTMHGSFTRDLDLVAVPWTDRAREPEHLARRVMETCGLKDTASNPGEKPHGRLVWTMRLPDFGDPRFVDFSIIPPTPATGSGGEER